jgi:hypothetical protein
MTPASHYREAEKDVEIANAKPIDDGEAAFWLARAQVHATLALAGATALGSLTGYDTARDQLGDAMTDAPTRPAPWAMTAPTPAEDPENRLERARAAFDAARDEYRDALAAAQAAE